MSFVAWGITIYFAHVVINIIEFLTGVDLAEEDRIEAKKAAEEKEK